MRNIRSLMKKFHKDQNGYSLMELLVAMAVSSILLGLIVSFVIMCSRNFNRQSNTINLQNEIQEANNAVTDALQEANALVIDTLNNQYTIQLDTYREEEVNNVKKVIFNSENTYKCIYYNPENSTLYVLDATGYQKKLAGNDASIEAYAYSRYVTEFGITKQDTMKDGTCVLTVHIKVQGVANGESVENDLKIATRNRVN